MPRIRIAIGITIAMLGLAAFVLQARHAFPISVLPVASPTPCETSGAIATARVQNVSIQFFCGIDAQQQALIKQFVGHALDAMPPGVSPAAEVFAFEDLNQGVSLQSDWLQQQGYSSAQAQLHLNWEDNHLLGQTIANGVFLYMGGDIAPADMASTTRMTVLHEMHHVLQFQLAGANAQPPVWFVEGGAQAFTDLELQSLGYPESDKHTSDYWCDYRLAELERDGGDVPEECSYIEGEHAVNVLLQAFGKQPYYQLLTQLGKGASFASAFQAVYGYSLDEFYQRFEQYRNSGYAHVPDFRAPSVIAAP